MGGGLNVKDISNKYWEKGIVIERKRDLELSFGWAKELELIPTKKGIGIY